VVEVNEISRVTIDIPAGSVLKSVVVEPSVTVLVPPGTETVVVEVMVVTEGQVGGGEVVELMLFLEALDVNEIDEVIPRQEQALEIREGR
jgi:molybdopterin-binding protein